MTKFQRIAYIFPGQGSQYIGMGKDFFESYPEARETFEEADDILSRKLSQIIFFGPEDVLTETKNSQTAIYVTSVALLRIVQKLFPQVSPQVCAGLSLGEYTALTASKRLSFRDGLTLVQLRGQFMNDACLAHQGTMAVVLGLESAAVEAVVKDVNLPNDLWIANYNTPGQVVISGTLKGIEVGSEAARAKGAKRVLPLQVHGAFHSGLMQSASDRLAEYIAHANIQDSSIDLVMNVPGDFVKDISHIRQNLVKQVSNSVRWEQGIHAMGQSGVDMFFEIGCGKTLAGMNRKIGVKAPTMSLEKVVELESIEKSFK